MRRSLRTTAVGTGLAVTALLAGCTGTRSSSGSGSGSSGSGSSGTVRPVPGRALFAPFDSCGDLLTHLKDQALRTVGPWGIGSGGGMILAAEGAVTRSASAAAPDANGAPKVSADTAGAAGSNSSGTNTQEQGVDEGDQVETDGRRVFTVVDGRLRIVDVVTGAQIGQATLPAGQHQLLLDGTRLVVVSHAGGWGGGPVRPMPMPAVGAPAAGDRAVIDGGPVGVATSGTTVAVYDVADPTQPTRRSAVTLEGDLIAARSAGGVVRLVLRSGLGDRIPMQVPNKPGSDAERKALEANKKAIAASTIEDWLPRSFAEGAGGSFTPLRQALSCTDVGRPSVDAGLGLTWLASLPLDGAGTPTVTGSAGVVATGDVAYLAADTLYVTTTVWPQPATDDDTRPARPEPARTAVHAFGLGAGAAAGYLASGEVPGRLLNSYAMSDHDGVLRIATTVDDDGFGAPSSSAVYTLRRNGDGFDRLGAVTGLGRTERIYAVRYVGPLAYVVTFRQTDPLYVVDLRDPAKPAAVGELKIPGYSAYLHPLGDGRLLGIGQDATDDGLLRGSQASLFDVTDPTAPARLGALALSSRGGSSDAEFDPHAFLWWPATGTVVVPVNGPADDGTWRSAAAVLQLDGDRLRIAGEITHDDRARGGSGAAQLRRSLIVDGRLVTVSDAGVKVNALDTLAPQAWVPFPS
jgi:hypothetical protein